MVFDAPLPPLTGIRTAEALSDALEALTEKPVQRLGQTLIDLGLITDGDLRAALAVQRTDHRFPVGELLVRHDRIDRQQLDCALNWTLGFPLVDVDHFPVQAEAVARVLPATAERLTVLPLRLQEGQLVVAMADPKRQEAVDELAWATECGIRPVVADAQAIRRQLRRWTDGPGGPTSPRVPGAALPSPLPAGAEGPNGPVPPPAGAPAAPQGADIDDPTGAAGDTAVVRAVNALLENAVARGASDIHLECPELHGALRIRLRLDGRMSDWSSVPAGDRAAWISRLKILAGLDITERRRPQDGRLQWTPPGGGTPLAFRVATIPTQQGLEDMVLRHLRSAAPVPLGDLGLQPEAAAAFRSAIEQPHGLVLCAGPTGSGKTTTLHSALALLNTPDRKIWTAEDPIEITQGGLRQVQVNARIGWTFDKALRALLRADPDVIMVGEIRDADTARVAVEASLTGHLVLSTIHTNSAADTVARLVDMGLDPFQFSDALRAVVGQRLLRRWCPHCVMRRPAPATRVDQWLDEALWSEDGAPPAGIEESPQRRALQSALRNEPRKDPRAALLARWARDHAPDGIWWETTAPGCSACQGTGRLGRVGIHEVLVASAGLGRLIQQRAPAEALHQWAHAHGMRSLRLDAMDKVVAGQIPLEEVHANLRR